MLMWTAAILSTVCIGFVGLTIRATRTRKPPLGEYRTTIRRLAFMWQALGLIAAVWLVGSVVLTHRVLTPEVYAWLAAGVYAPLSITL